ncbi:MAG: SRPBCC family protein [Novosphingobium sp.]
MRFAVAAICSALAFAAPAAAEVTATGDGAFISRNVVEVSASQWEAWQAMIAPNTWWNGEHTYSGDPANMWLDAQATGCFCEKLPVPKEAPPGTRAGSVEHMHIVYAAPGAALRMVGGLGPLQSEAVKGVLTVTFKPLEGGKTRILWEYSVGGYMRYETPKIAVLVDTVMAEQLKRLGDKLGLAAPAEAKPEDKPDTKSEPAEKPAADPG